MALGSLIPFYFFNGILTQKRHLTTSSDKSQETKDKNLEGVQERDKIKKQWAIDNGFVLLEITYADLDNLQELLFKEMHIASA